MKFRIVCTMLSVYSDDWCGRQSQSREGSARDDALLLFRSVY